MIVRDKPGMIGSIGNKLGKMNISIKNIVMEQAEDNMQVTLSLKLPPKMLYDTVMEQLLSIDGIISIDYQD